MPHVYGQVDLYAKVISFFLYTNMEEYHLRYHDDVYTDSFHVLSLSCRKMVNNNRMNARTFKLPGVVHTNAFSKVRDFVVIANASIYSRLHYRFDAFSNVQTYENDRIARCDIS